MSSISPPVCNYERERERERKRSKRIVCIFLVSLLVYPFRIIPFPFFSHLCEYIYTSSTFFFFFSLFEAFLRSTPSNFSYHRLSSSSRRWNSLADLHAMAARLPSILSPPCILCEYESCIYLGLEQRGCSSNFSSNPLEKKLRAAATYRTISSLNRATKILHLSVFLSLFNSFSLRFF